MPRQRGAGIGTVTSLIAALAVLMSGAPAVAQLPESPVAVAAQASPHEAMLTWFDALGMDTRVEAEIGRFQHDDRMISDSYRGHVASAIRDLVLEAARVRLAEFAAGGCEPYVKAEFPSAGFATEDPDDVEDRFEGGFVKTEMIACFRTEMAPDSLLAIYTSPDFRMEVESRLERIWMEDDLSCVETGGMWALLDPTLSCNRIDRYVEGDIASEHSQVVRNQGEEPFQDIYFKESFKTFVRIPGGVALHYINYSRSIRLGRLKRAVGRGKIEGSQENNARALADRISSPGTARP